MSTFKSKGSKGSIIVDAACCLPVFIVALCILLMLIAQTGIEDTVFFTMSRAADTAVSVIAAADTDENSSTGIPEKAAAYSAFAASLRTGTGSDWTSSSRPSVRISSMDFDLEETLADGTHIDRMIRADISFDTKIPVPGTFIRKISSSRTILFRPWCGESKQGSSFDDTQVFIFPKHGEHYHNANCSCLKNGEIQTILNKSLRKRYSGCSTCHADRLADGSPVFLMSSGSGAYHRKTCPCITKAYESIALSDARSMGYTPCGLCGGSAENYDPQNDLFK